MAKPNFEQKELVLDGFLVAYFKTRPFNTSTRVCCIMLPIVRDLYKRVLTVGREYPKGLAWVREKAKAKFFENRHLTDEGAIKKAVHEGRWYVKEMVATIQFKKYRAMKNRYD